MGINRGLGRGFQGRPVPVLTRGHNCREVLSCLLSCQTAHAEYETMPCFSLRMRCWSWLCGHGGWSSDLFDFAAHHDGMVSAGHLHVCQRRLHSMA